MKKVHFVAVVSFLAAGGNLLAACKDGTVVSCKVGTKTGTRECINGRFTPCDVEPDPPPPPPTGTVKPRFYILSVIYSPPGTQGGGSGSSVAYGSGSTTGTTVSSSNSFKQNYKLSATASGGVLGGVQVGASFAYGRNSTNASAIDIKKSTNSEITVRGPGQDGIDHDRDQIWLWLNPKIGMTVTPTSATWTLKDTQTADIQFVFVGHLKNPSLMPPGVMQRLQTYGITPQDFPEMLKANPFASGATTIDPARFQVMHTTFPYEPPFAPGDPATTFKTTIANSTTDTSSRSTQNDYIVGLSVSGDTNFFSIFKTSIKAESSWTWTNTSATANSTNTSESASVTVGGPAFGYTGPTDMAVYYDVLYKTFMFAPVTGPIELRGVVTSRSRKIAAGQEVLVVAGGKQYRTFTNAKGEYRIPGKMAGPVQLRVGRVSKNVPQAGPNVNIELP